MLYGFGRGMACRRGWGRGWGPFAEPTVENLREEIEALKEEKKDIDAEIVEIEEMLKNKAPR